MAGDAGAVHANPEAIFSACGLGDFVVVIPEFEAAGVVPVEPLAIDGIVPVFLLWDRFVGEGEEFGFAIFAVADVVAFEAVPDVVGETVGVGAFDDFAHDVGEVVVVVGAVDAGEVELTAAVGLAGGVDGEPVGVSVVERGEAFGGVHAGDDGEAVVVGGFGEFAEEVAVGELGRAVVEGEFGGVVGDDSAGVDDDALRAGALPVLPPPGDVVGGAVGFGDVGLSPAEGALMPGELGIEWGLVGCGCGLGAGGERRAAAIVVVVVASVLRKSRRVVGVVMWGPPGVLEHEEGRWGIGRNLELLNSEFRVKAGWAPWREVLKCEAKGRGIGSCWGVTSWYFSRRITKSFLPKGVIIAR